MSVKISVIIPTFNRLQLLQKAVNSILGQSFTDCELIIVDDGSTDGTAGCFSRYHDRIRLLYQENRGPAAARNKAIRVARGELIAFLDSDDMFFPDKLAVQQAAMAAEPEYLISHTDEVWYKQGKLMNQKKKHAKPHGDIFPQCLRQCVVGMSTVMLRREFFDLIGFLDESLPCCEDYDLWLRASIRLPFLKIERALTIKNGGRPDQVSSRYQVGMDKFRIQSLVKILEGKELSAKQRSLASLELQRKCRIYGNGCFKHGRPEEGTHYLKLAEVVFR